MSRTNDLELRKENEMKLPVADLTKCNLPNLDNAQEMPVDLCGNYWTPEMPGEYKRVFFVEIKQQMVLSANDTGELIPLDCAIFIENKDGVLNTISNGSRRLVGILEQHIVGGAISNGTPLKITYMGKRRNKTNSFSSDNWSVIPLRIEL